MILPWHQQVWDRLVQQQREGRLPHALLCVGPEGVGKRVLVEQLIASLLCVDAGSDGLACGRCDRCQRRLGGTHPDLRYLTPEEGSQVLKVDQIRELSAFVTLTSQFGGWKIGVIDPADWMNVNAANALLKTLEEPSPGSLLVLISDRPSSLPATVRSRCQRVDVRVPGFEAALRWLQEETRSDRAAEALRRSAGMPLLARTILEDDGDQQRRDCFKQWQALTQGGEEPVSMAAEWTSIGALQCLGWLTGWIEDQLRLAAGTDEASLRNADLTDQYLLPGIAADGVFRRLDRLYEARRLVQTSANDQQVLENVLFDWYRIAAAKPA